MFNISNTTKKNIERVTGLTMDKIRTMTPQEEIEWMKRERNKKTFFLKSLIVELLEEATHCYQEERLELMQI